MKRITIFLFLVFFALWTGQSQTVSKTAISNQKVNSTKSVAVLDSQMENKVGNSQSNQSNAAIDELLARVESLGTQVENVTEFFTTSEIQQLRAHFQQARGFNVHPVYEVRSDNNAYGINNAIPSFGSFNHLAPAGTFTPLSGGSGTAGFEGAGAIDPANPSVGYAMDIDGFLYQVNVDTGVYTNLGNTGVLEVNGMAFNPVDGTLYAITGTSVYTVDPSVSSLTLVGVHGIPGTFAIALGISDDGVGYTYDIGLDQLFSINLSTGVATLIGNIGFDANFGQGMDWDAATGTMYMSAFNMASFNTEIRSVNLTTGATTLIGYIDTVNLVQMGWVSFVGSSGGGGGDCSSPTVDINQDQENTCMATISQQGIAQSFTAESPMSAGAGLKFNGPVSGGQVLEIYLYDELPTNGGVVLASGSTTTAGGETWIDVYWTAAPTTIGDIYYLIIEGSVSGCIAGTTFDSYSGGHLYANSGYTPFPDWDYTFRHYGCDSSGGGGDCEPGVMMLPFDASFNEFAGNMFNVAATGGEDVLIEGFDVNIDPGVATIAVYYREGTYVGFENSSAGWTLLGTEQVTSAGENMPTHVEIGGVTIPDGETYGFYVSVTDYDVSGVSMNYTNGSNTFSDSYVQVTLGAGKGSPDFTGATFADRIWNGNIYYCAGEGGGGGGDCSSPVVDINQDESNTCMALISQTGIAQSFTAESDTSAGAGFMFTTDVAAGQALQIGLWDNLPNSGGVLMASGSVTTAGGDAWVDVYWDTPASTTIGDMYYLVVEGSVAECMAGTTYDSYPGGHLYANAGYGPFPDWDYTFRHYGCEGGGGGGDECTYETLSNGVEDGTPNSLYGTANDFIVPADETFTMEQVVVPILTLPGTTISYVDLTYFDNSGSNLPGTTLGSETGVTPTSQDIIGSAFGFDVREVVLDITPFTFTAGATDTNFWVQVHSPNTAGSATYWESNTTGSVLGYPTAGFDGAVWSYTWGSNYDGVFQYNGDCSGSGGGGGPVGDCDEENARIGAVLDGLNCSIGGGFKVANDITVPADFDFHLEQIRANILSVGDITEVNVVYYDHNNNTNLPGTQLASEMGLSPTSQTVVGSAFGYDVIEITLDVPTYIFAGQMGSTTTYWIGLEVSNVSSSTSIFWEVTNENAVGYATAFNNGGWSIWDPSADGVYLWGGNCEPVIVNSEEAPLIGFSYYPNPASDVIYLQADQIIDSVGLYNVLGQQVLSQSVKAQSSQLDVSGLAAGTYFMSVESEGTLHTYQVIKK